MAVDYSEKRMDIEQAARIAMELYDIEGKAIPLPGEVDLNFRLETSSKSYLLKISPPDADAAILEFQQF